MSENCVIRVILDVEFNRENIHTILKRGDEKGFNYHFFDKKNDKNPFSTAEEATQKFLTLSNPEDGQERIFTVLYEYQDITEFSDFALVFYKDINGRLELQVACFGEGCVKKENHFDLIYYLPLFLSICKDFIAIKVIAELIEDY